MTSENTGLRILHTSDWHLGKRLHGYDRSKEYDYFRDALMEAIANEHPDMLLIAGDIFDNVTPTFEAEKYFGKTLNMIRTRHPDLHIVVTSGNHDSGRKIENISIYMETCENLKIVGELPLICSGENDSVCEPNYEALVYPAYSRDKKLMAVTAAMPFLSPSVAVKLSLGSPDADYEAMTLKIYQDCLRYIHERFPETQTGQVPVIAMGHFYVKKTDIGTQEEGKVSIIGGEGQVDSSIFDGYDYTALGHIHLRQNIAGSRRIRYSGSPLPINFGELGYDNGIDMVELNPQVSEAGKAGFEISVHTLPIKRQVQFIRIPREPRYGSEEEVLQGLQAISSEAGLAAREKNPGGLPFLSVYAEYDPEHTSYPSVTKYREYLDSIINKLTGSVARVCDNAVSVKTSKNAAAGSESRHIESLNDVADPMTLAARMFRETNNGAEMPQDLRMLLDEIIREAEGNQAAAAENAK